MMMMARMMAYFKTRPFVKVPRDLLFSSKESVTESDPLTKRSDFGYWYKSNNQHVKYDLFSPQVEHARPRRRARHDFIASSILTNHSRRGMVVF